MDLEILKVAKSLEGDDRDMFQSMYSDRQRSVGTGILLALLLGEFGAHAFYLGKNQKGVWLLVGTFVGFITLFIVIGIIPLLAVMIVSIIDAINMGSLVKSFNRNLAAEIKKEIEYLKD